MGSLTSWQESEVTATTTSVSDMLEARRASVWKTRYDIIADGRRLATWDESSWKGGGKIELVTPMADGFVSRFLERRGEGVHHVTFRVRDIERQAERLREAGVPLTLTNFENANWKELFLHPSTAHGVLIQLAESPNTDDDTARHFADLFPEAALLGD